MQLRITHDTCYDYIPAVDIAQHMTHLQPLNLPTQTVLAHAVDISPQPAQRESVRDVFGNTRVFFSLQSAHSQLRIVARSLVTTQTLPDADSTEPWEAVQERYRYVGHHVYDSAAEFVFASPFVVRHADFEAYAAPSLTPDRPLVLAARELMQRIHQDFTYDSQSTEINTPALQALAQRKGVCQDFAHIMIACLRTCGLPARYVSGYLLTQAAPGAPRLVGADASHAWVSVYLPDLPGASAEQCWWDFDPTNNRDGWGSPGADYVTLAIGRDFGDVSPVRGVIRGGAHHTLQVAVTVEALPDGAWLVDASGQSQTQSQGLDQNPAQFQGQSMGQPLPHSPDAIE